MTDNNRRKETCGSCVHWEDNTWSKCLTVLEDDPACEDYQPREDSESEAKENE